MAREATRKIAAIFSLLSSVLRCENQTLKDKLGQLECELKTVTENLENARMWRENVLSGCPVLFQESGLIFTLKLFGKLSKKQDELTEGVAGISLAAAAVQSGREDGMFQFEAVYLCVNG